MKNTLMFVLILICIPLLSHAQSFDEQVKSASIESLIKHKAKVEAEMRSSIVSGAILASIAVPAVIGGGILAASDYEGQIVKFLPLGVGVILGVFSISSFSSSRREAKKKELIELELLKRGHTTLLLQTNGIKLVF